MKIPTTTTREVRNAAFKLSIELVGHCKTIPEAQKKIKSFMKDLDDIDDEFQERVRAQK